MQSLEEQLAHTQKQLDDLREEYKEFVYIVSHDLSAPLRAIEGFSQIIAKKHADSFDEKTLGHFNHIITGTQKNKAILSALLDYSRISTQGSEFITCDCNAIMDHIKEELSSIIESSQATLHCEQLPIIFADEMQLTLLFKHLIHNALLYQKGDTNPIIHITCTSKNNISEFSVSDNGMGIKKNIMEKIFKILRRGVSDKNYPGMGMGLAIAQKIVQRHGGQLSMKSEVGSGTTFSFTITNATHNN
jgi:light-regulated signal transduction histidine kinase (bacteriophytochrome)